MCLKWLRGYLARFREKRDKTFKEHPRFFRAVFYLHGTVMLGLGVGAVVAIIVAPTLSIWGYVFGVPAILLAFGTAILEFVYGCRLK